jgi:DNA-binding CsgD family transcriptional regulator
MIPPRKIHQQDRMNQVPPFVARAQELQVLAASLDRAASGQGSTLLLAGEAGVGKSRLLEEAASRAAAGGWSVLSGRAYDTEGMPPYLPFVEVIRAYLKSSPDSDHLGLLTDLPEMAVLIPELREHRSEDKTSRPASPEAERLRLFDGVSEFLLRVARDTEAKGLLLQLDDLHWADRSTLSLLLHLARKVKNTRILIAGAYRTEEAGPGKALSDMLVELGRERLDDRLILDRFSVQESSGLIEGMTGRAPAAAVSEALHAQTEGNVFFLEELVRELQAEQRDLSSTHALVTQWPIPQGVRAIIEQRATRVSEDTRRVLQAAAVLGEGFAVHLVQAVSELSAPAVVDALEEATRAALLREDGSLYGFSHALVRQVLYEGISLARSQQLHSRAAEALEARSQASGPATLAAIGHHWRLGGRPDRAVEFLLRAGDAAITLTAWTEAAVQWEAAERCMEEVGQSPAQRARLMEGVGDLYYLSSFGAQDCVAQYDKAATLYESAGDSLGAARAHSRAGRSLAWPTSGFDYPGAIEQLHTAEQLLSHGPDTIELGETYAALAHAETHALLTDTSQMLSQIERLKTIAEKLDNDYLRVGAYSMEGHYLALQGRLSEGIALEDKAFEAAKALGGGSVNQWPERWRDFLLAYSSTENVDSTEDVGSFVLSRWYGRLLMTRWTASCCGLQSLELNDPVKARAPHDTIRDPQGRLINPLLFYDLFLSGDISEIRRMIEAGSKEMSTANDVMAFGPALLAWCEGRWQDVKEFMEPRPLTWHERGSNSMVSMFNRWLVRLYRTISEPERARQVLEESLDISLRSGAVKFEFPCRAELALLLVETKQLKEAEEQLNRVREVLAEGEDWRGLSGRAELAEAAVAAAHSQTEASDHFERAIDIFRRYSLPWDEAEAWEVWAQLGRGFYRGRARRDFVTEKLAGAEAVYQRIGAGQPWLDRLVVEASHLLGESKEEEYPDGLTGREVEVLRSIAAGASNRDIAETLVVSIRTVERHITHIYAKIGARGKADATAYALRHELMPARRQRAPEGSAVGQRVNGRK